MSNSHVFVSAALDPWVSVEEDLEVRGQQKEDS